MLIKEYREAARLSQKEAAERIGVTSAAICNWEKGIRSPRTQLLPIIASVFGCKISDLFEEGSHE